MLLVLKKIASIGLFVSIFVLGFLFAPSSVKQVSAACACGAWYDASCTYTQAGKTYRGCSRCKSNCPPPPPPVTQPTPQQSNTNTPSCRAETYNECCGPGTSRRVTRNCPSGRYDVGACNQSDGACGAPASQPVSCPAGTFWYPVTNDCRGASSNAPPQSTPVPGVDPGTTGGVGMVITSQTYSVKPKQCTYVKDGRSVTTSVCSCAYGYTCSPGNYGPVPPGNLDCLVVQGSDITCTKIGGTPTTLSGGQGTACDNPLSRGACGADGCVAGQQRLCVRNSAGQTVLGGCDVTDACASQVQNPPSGGSCSGLRQLSVGEKSHGAFVGCQGNQNCFCDGGFGKPLTGNVRCYADTGNDSCGAPGVGSPAPVAITQSSTPPSTTPPSTPPFVCLSVSKDIATPTFGQSVRFTCGTVSGATKYEFKYKVGTTVGDVQPLNTGSNLTQPFAITHAGSYKVQCRPCTGTECAPWAENW